MSKECRLEQAYSQTAGTRIRVGARVAAGWALAWQRPGPAPPGAARTILPPPKSAPAYSEYPCIAPRSAAVAGGEAGPYAAPAATKPVASPCPWRPEKDSRERPRTGGAPARPAGGTSATQIGIGSRQDGEGGARGQYQVRVRNAFQRAQHLSRQNGRNNHTQRNRTVKCQNCLLGALGKRGTTIYRKTATAPQ